MSCYVPLIPRTNDDVVVLPVENKSLLTSVFESSFNTSLMALKTMVLVLPKIELHIVPWVTGGCSELKQLGCLVLLFR
jgi:hypothetical protein